MIEVCDAVKCYGSFEAVKNLSFSVKKGEILGLLGPNGAGKTTLIKILTGFHYPTFGKAMINGMDIVDQSLAVRSIVGYLPEMVPLYTDLQVCEYLEFIADIRNLKGNLKKERIDYVVKECGLKGVFYKPIDALSKGYKQRVGLAQAIIHDPEILILDEPTTGLDPNQIIEIRELIKRFGKEKTVILSTHILQEVEAVCDRVLILNEGKIVAGGTTAEIRKELRGKPKVELLVKGKEGQSPEKLLLKLNYISDCSLIEANIDRYKLKLSIDSEENLEDLFDWAVSSGFKILQMIPSVISLEEIFIQLTTEKEAINE